MVGDAYQFDQLNSYVVGDASVNQIKMHLSEQTHLGHVLELACGTGIYTEILLNNANMIVATDYSEQMLDCVKNKFHDSEKIHFEQANCLALQYPENEYDTVFMANLIHIISDPVQTLVEAKRVLKPGGKVLLMSFTMDGMTLIEKIKMGIRYFKSYGKPPQTSTPFTLKQLTSLVQKCGFHIDEAILLGVKSKAMLIVATKQ